jgi:hypothetical protein
LHLSGASLAYFTRAGGCTALKGSLKCFVGGSGRTNPCNLEHPPAIIIQWV